MRSVPRPITCAESQTLAGAPTRRLRFPRPAAPMRRLARPFLSACALLAGALAATAAPAAAQSACAAGSLASYLALGTTGCAITGAGGLGARFGGFGTTVSAPASAPQAVTLTPFTLDVGGGLTAYGFDVNYGGTVVSAGTNFNYAIFTTGTALVGSVAGSLVGTPTGSVTNDGGQIFGVLATGVGPNAFRSCSRVSGTLTCTGPAQQLYVGGTAPLDVSWLTGAFSESSGGTARLDTFRVGLIVGPAQVVPEPGTYALVGAGLLAVAGMARRRRA